MLFIYFCASGKLSDIYYPPAFSPSPLGVILKMNMKKIILFLILTISNTAFASCIQLGDLFSLLLKDIEQQESFLESEGYILRPSKDVLCSETCNCLEFYNKEFDFFLNIGRLKSTSKCIYAQFRLKSSGDCYNQIKNQISSFSLIKDKEVHEYDAFHYWYSNKKNGVIFSKWIVSNADYYHYSVTVYEMSQYLEIKK